MNWRLFGWLAALFGGAVIAVIIVVNVIQFVLGAIGGILAFIFNFALFIAVVGGVIWLGLKAKKALAEMKSGDVLKVLATDPGSMRDFQAFARQTGNELLEQSSAADEFVHYLKRR